VSSVCSFLISPLGFLSIRPSGGDALVVVGDTPLNKGDTLLSNFAISGSSVRDASLPSRSLSNYS